MGYSGYGGYGQTRVGVSSRTVADPSLAYYIPYPVPLPPVPMQDNYNYGGYGGGDNTLLWCK
jgi:hypothetical protein